MRTLKLIAIVVLVTALCAPVMAAKQQTGGTVKPDWWGGAPGQHPNVNGTVANISATNIAVQTKEGLKSFTVSDRTKVLVRGKQATITDVKVGDLVQVKFRLVQNNVPLAVAIRVPKPLVRGRITAIEGNVVTLKPKEGEPIRVLTTDQTKYAARGYQGTFADLRVGYGAAAIGEPGDGGFAADVIEFVPAVAKGTVVAREGDVITVKTVRQLTIVCLASPATAVLVRPRIGPNRKGTLADIQVGMPCNIGFHPNPQGQSPLLWIDLLTGQ